jgi:Fic family protein
LDGYLWNEAKLEGNPLNFAEVKTLMDGITVGQRKIADVQQVMQLIYSGRFLLNLLKAGKFEINRNVFTALHSADARNAPNSPRFFKPELIGLFEEGVTAVEAHVQDPFEKGAAFFLFGALQQFFLDGNKRTSRFMMNGILMTAGIDAISVPASKAQDFNEKMVRFYMQKDATEMMAFLV